MIQNGIEERVLNQVKKIENNPEYGGAVGIANLVKSSDMIYGSKIMGINTVSVDSSWYEASYIVGRYKTLTGTNPSGANYEAKVKNIRDRTKIEDVIKYYEYMQFKKAIFKSINQIKYSSESGRVIEMSFEFTGEFM